MILARGHRKNYCWVGNVVYKFCIKPTQNKEDGEDLYQQTFLKAIELKHKGEVVLGKLIGLDKIDLSKPYFKQLFYCCSLSLFVVL